MSSATLRCCPELELGQWRNHQTFAREKSSPHMFVTILTRATDAAALNDLDEHEWAGEPGGLAGAIQPSARSLAEASSLMVAAIQHLFALVRDGRHR